MNNNRITLNPLKITIFLSIIAFLLVLAHILVLILKFGFGHPHVRGFSNLFDLGKECNCPTTYAVLLLSISSLLLSIIAILNKKSNLPHNLKWWVLSLGFLFMAFDEACQLHERLITPVRNILNTDTYGLLFFAWIIPALILILILGIYFLKFLIWLPKRTRLLFLLAGIVFIGGAIGFEALGGREIEQSGDSLLANIWCTFEESFELGGIIIFIYALLDYSSDTFKKIQFYFSE